LLWVQIDRQNVSTVVSVRRREARSERRLADATSLGVNRVRKHI